MKKDVEEPKNQDLKPKTLITPFLTNLFLNKSSFNVSVITLDTFTFNIHSSVLLSLYDILKRMHNGT